MCNTRPSPCPRFLTVLVCATGAEPGGPPQQGGGRGPAAQPAPVRAERQQVVTRRLRRHRLLRTLCQVGLTGDGGAAMWPADVIWTAETAAGGAAGGGRGRQWQ